MDGAIIIFGLLFWGICGFISGNIAKDKGRDQTGWFIGGLILGPIGVALAAIASPDQQTVERVAFNRGELRKCPSCQELIKSAATKCRYCGDKVDPLSEPSTRSATSLSVVGTCFLCGFELFNEVPICPKCGRRDPLARPSGDK